MERLIIGLENALVALWFCLLAALGISMLVASGVGALGLMGFWPAPLWATLTASSGTALVGAALWQLERRIGNLGPWIWWMATALFVALARYGIALHTGESSYSHSRGIALGIVLASWAAYRRYRRNRADRCDAEDPPPLTHGAE